MEKIRLVNGTEMEILNGAAANSITMSYGAPEDVIGYCNTLSEENLAKYEILSEEGLVCTMQENKHVRQIVIDVEKQIATFNLADVDMLAKRIAELEQTQSEQDIVLAEIMYGGNENE